MPCVTCSRRIFGKTPDQWALPHVRSAHARNLLTGSGRDYTYPRYVNGSCSGRLSGAAASQQNCGGMVMKQRGVISRRIQPVVAFRSIRTLLANPEETALV